GRHPAGTRYGHPGAPGGNLPGRAGQVVALGTARFQAGDLTDGQLELTPVTPGRVSERDTPRIVPAEILEGRDPAAVFPRIPDGLPDAWSTPVGRFTPEYEERARVVWETLAAAGYSPEFWWAGSEDGEVIAVPFGECGEAFLVGIEEPDEQVEIDAHIAAGSRPSRISAGTIRGVSRSLTRPGVTGVSSSWPSVRSPAWKRAVPKATTCPARPGRFPPGAPGWP
ncbi:hypothetical protein R6G99_10160, partial [Actinotignum timonense]|nr:hypothetical protein [Actinotignum timonense]